MKITSIVLLFFLGSCAKLDMKTSSPLKNKTPYRVSWVKNLDPVYNTGNLPVGNSSPFVFQDIVYMGSLSGKMSAYNLETGALVWEHDEGQAIQAPAEKFGDYIYYGSLNGRLFARHYLSGELKYATDLGTPIESAAVLTSGRLILHLRNHTIMAIDAMTGKIFWSYQRSVTFSSTLQRVSKVLPYDNSLIVGFADGYIASLSLEEGILNWEQRISSGVKFVDVDVEPIYFNGKIVAGSAAGQMKFLDPKNGFVIKSVDIVQSHKPVIDNDELIVGTVFGEITKVGKEGNIIDRKKLSDVGISGITKWKDRYVVTTMGEKVYFLNKDFSPYAEFNLGHDQSAIFGDVAVSNEGHIVFYSSRNRLYTIK